MPPETPEKSADQKGLPVKPALPLAFSTPKKVKDQNPTSSATGSLGLPKTKSATPCLIPSVPIITPRCEGRRPASSATDPSTQTTSDAEPAFDPPPSTPSKMTKERWDDSPPPDSPSKFLEGYSPRKSKPKDPNTSHPCTPTKGNKTAVNKYPKISPDKELETPEEQIIPDGETVTPTAPFTQELRKGVRLADGRVVGEDGGSPPEKRAQRRRGR